jgi:serine-type D-Ala-D-Ala carboxypeptidase (penicillin-binding protein 5/6)
MAMNLLASILMASLGPLSFFIAPKIPPVLTIQSPADSRLLAAQLPLWQEPSVPPEYVPYRDWRVGVPEVDAKAALVEGSKSGKIYYERNMRERLPIASLTKLATALAVIEAVDPGEKVAVTKHAVGTDGDFGNLVVGEELAAGDLMRAMLIASSNDAAVALADYVSATKSKNLIEIMNANAQILDMKDTHFASVNGLEDDNNYSTPADLAKLFKAAAANTYIFDIMQSQSADVLSADGKFTHRLVTSNKLLGDSNGVIAGKTGYTEKAGGNLAELVRNQNADDDFMVVVLGSTNEDTRFEAARTLIEWVGAAYKW